MTKYGNYDAAAKKNKSVKPRFFLTEVSFIGFTLLGHPTRAHQWLPKEAHGPELWGFSVQLLTT